MNNKRYGDLLYLISFGMFEWAENDIIQSTDIGNMYS